MLCIRTGLVLVTIAAFVGLLSPMPHLISRVLIPGFIYFRVGILLFRNLQGTPHPPFFLLLTTPPP